MRTRSLKATIFLSFMAVIVVFCFFVVGLGIFFIKTNIIDSTQAQVTDALDAANTVFNEKIREIGFALRLGLPTDNYEAIKAKANLDYIYEIPIDKIAQAKSLIAKQAAIRKQASGVRIISHEQINELDHTLVQKVNINVKDTPKTGPTAVKVLRDGIAVEYALAITDESGKVTAVLCAGDIINRDYALVDRIRDLVFEKKDYQGVPIGTVTIFQDDIRIATNVLDKQGNRAIGTRVSKIVYDNVVLQDKTWLDRAFVVTDWYITAYKPIKDIKGKIIGILYVGILEKPFIDIAKNTLIAFLAIIVIMGFVAIIVSVLLSAMIAKPVTETLKAMNKMSRGELKNTVKHDKNIKELNQLSDSFNEMAQKLEESYKDIKISNEHLEGLNKDYLDLIGFVSHELKGILASTILNAYSVRDGFLGMVNFKQQKALNSITRNLDYLDATVKNFLNLSRIEKGEMNLNRIDIDLKADIIEYALDNFAKQITEKEMIVTDDIPQDYQINADRDLLLIVVNNLISNAIKYGYDKGQIKITASKNGDKTKVSIYNDAEVIKEEQKVKMFKKFSRLNTERTRKVKGTGLGLFLTKEIIEAHGGHIFVNGLENGNEFVFEV